VAYSGTWKKTAVTQPDVPLVQAADPSHGFTGHESVYDPNLNENWVDDTLAPGLTSDLLGDQLLQLPTYGGPVDRSTDTGHEGDGDGQTYPMSTLTAQDYRGQVMDADLGSVEARRWRPVDARDGAYHVVVLDDVPGDGTPGTAQNTLRQITGVGAANSPDARVGRKIKRWRDRWIDMHRWDPEERASVLRYAYTAPAKQEQDRITGLGDQYVSPFPTLAMYGAEGIGTPDQFVTPSQRRAPRPWDEAMTDNGYATGGDYGLGTWGL
jgi:hypothetical protein